MRPDPCSKNIVAIAGNPALAFLNSTSAQNGVRIEGLSDADKLLNWLEKTGLLPTHDCAIIRSKFNARDLEKLLAEAIELRDKLRALLFTFRNSGFKAISQKDFDYLNEVLSLGKHHFLIEIGPEHSFHMAQTNEWSSIREALALIAEPMLHLLNHENPEYIKQCANPTCGLWFIDKTKAHRRQWCSQSDCGNRAKVAAFRFRRQGKSD